MGKCKNCRFFNDFVHTYIPRDDGIDICSFWHTVYFKSENAGERDKDCFSSKNIQLTINFEL